MLKPIPLNMAHTVMTGGPTVFITSRSRAGVDNVMANAWNTLYEMGDKFQVIVVLDMGHTTTETILDTGVFGISVPGTALRRELMASGFVHGRDVGDKFKHLNIAKTVSPVLDIPFVDGALAQLSCRVLDRDLLARTGIMLAEVIDARVEETYWSDDEGFVTHDRPQTTMHAAGNAKFFERAGVRSWREGL